MKKKMVSGCFVATFLVSLLYIIGFVCACSFGDTDKETQVPTICLVSNNCFTYEKSGENFAESSDHEFGSDIYDADGAYSEFRIKGYSHIHYLLPKINGGYYCAAIGGDGFKYLLSVSDERKVDSFVKVSSLPAKLFESKDGLVAYYIGDSEAELYAVDFTTGQQTLQIDGVSIYGSGWSETLESYGSEQKFFDLYEYKYEEYIKSGKDLPFTLFDEKCFENVYVNDNKVAYKTAHGENKDKWIVKQDKKETEFIISGRCFGFIGENELLFYKSIPMGLYDIGLFYKYDYIKEKKNDFKLICNQGVGYGTISADKDNLCFIGSWDFGGACINCMDTETYEHHEIMSNYFGGTFIIVP